MNDLLVRRSPFLSIYSIMQSYFRYRMIAYYRRQQGRILLGYAFLLAVVNVSILLASPTVDAMLLGLTFPGAGFVHGACSDQAWLAAALFSLSLCVFSIAILLWFGTGNVILPVTVWLGAALLAGFPMQSGLLECPAPAVWPWLIGPALLMMGTLRWLRPAQRIEATDRATDWSSAAVAKIDQTPDELPAEDWQRLRLLLDRALQPVEQFDGFEWRDQFQTAAVRYQVNFMSYALAMAQRRHAPATQSYFAKAQENLLAKIGDRRMWSYWQLENAWGNFRLNDDPVPHQNIMYSGFTVLQMALGGGDRLNLHHRAKVRRSYGLDEIMNRLDAQYRSSRYGLLACEPNWIYPLCNLITMAGLRAADARLGTDRWHDLAEPFLASLDREATDRNGGFIAFRSALTGIAPPAPGGIVMQAFPCLFLNVLSPERAQEHWRRVRQRLDHGSWRRLFWPVDVGNYGFSRASSYAATAAAATEMGDTDIARECLRRLEAECPSREAGGVIHRERASLWAHALEMLARSNRADGLRHLILDPSSETGPHLASTPYPEVLVARAACEGQILDLILDPGDGPATPLLEFGGLMPGRHYHTGQTNQAFVKADQDGRAALQLALTERTRLYIKPVV